MISTKKLSFLLQSAVKAGAEKCFRDGGLLRQELSLSEAYAIYGIKAAAIGGIAMKLFLNELIAGEAY